MRWRRLERLQTLELSGTRLSGTLPSTMDALKSLRYLGLAYTRISGTLPEALTSMNGVLLPRHDAIARGQCTLPPLLCEPRPVHVAQCT